MINNSKTELLLIGSKQQLAKVQIDTIVVRNSEVFPSSSVCNLGVFLDSHMSMASYINKTCASAFYYLYNIRRIRKYLSVKVTESLFHTLVTSRIDHCNSLLFGLPDCRLNKLQRVLTAAARLIYMAPKFCHITPILVELHWLPVRWRIDYKILLITFKAINGLAPLYLSDLVSIKSSTYSLRSNDSKILSVLFYLCSTQLD